MQKLSVAKWKLLAPMLSEKAMRRIQEAGIPISAAREAAGINRGSLNMLKETGFTLRPVLPRVKPDGSLPDIVKSIKRYGGEVPDELAALAKVKQPTADQIQRAQEIIGTLRVQPEVNYAARSNNLRHGGYITLPEAHPLSTYEPRSVYINQPGKTLKERTLELGPVLRSPLIKTKNPELSDLADALVLRHEAYEAKAFNKALKKGLVSQYIPQGRVFTAKNLNPKVVKEYLKSSIQSKGLVKTLRDIDNLVYPVGNVGEHFSPNVLINETKLINRLANRGGADAIKKYRLRSGEASSLADNIGLSSGKDLYSKALTNKDYRDMRNLGKTFGVYNLGNKRTIWSVGDSIK